MNFRNVLLQIFIAWCPLATIISIFVFQIFLSNNSFNDMLPSQISKAQIFWEEQKYWKTLRLCSNFLNFRNVLIQIFIAWCPLTTIISIIVFQIFLSNNSFNDMTCFLVKSVKLRYSEKAKKIEKLCSFVQIFLSGRFIWQHAA